jgi:anti-sigma factor RsiW
MNHDTEQKLLAHLDHELSQEESSAVAKMLGQDTQAKALFEELRATKELLHGNELQRTLPELRDFYWSKIKRDILAAERARDSQHAAPPLSKWWMRLVAPLAGTSFLVVVLLMALRNSQSNSYFHEVETPVEESTGITFHSESAHMTIVWIPSQQD